MSKSTLQISALLLIAVLISACGSSPCYRTATTLNTVESYINEQPDSALAVLRSLDPATLHGPSRRARYALLHSMALDKCYIDLQTDSILAPALTWYDRHGSPDDKLKTLYYLGRIQYNAKEYPKAIVTYTEALDNAGKASDIKYIGFVNQAISDTYAASYLAVESLPYLDEAYRLFLQIPDSSLAKKTLYKKALSLRGQRKWKSADSLFRFLLDRPQGIEAIVPRIQADYALQLVLEGLDSTKALSLFKESLSAGGSLPTINHWGAYAYALLINGEEQKSHSLFAQLQDLYPNNDQVQYWLTYEKVASKDYEDAYRLLHQTLMSQDSLLQTQLKQSTVVAQKEFFAGKAAQTQQNNRRKSLILWLSLVSFAFFLLAGWLVVHHRAQSFQREKARLMLTVETTKKHLETMQQEQKTLGDQMSALFKDYFTTLGRICADYEEGLIHHASGQDRLVLRRIDRIVNDFMGDSDGHMAFEQQLDKHLNNIMSRFRSDFPKMRKEGYFLVSYVFAGIDMQTISVLMALDIDALYARKYRIKHMISGSDVPDKQEYLTYFG